MVKHTLFHLIAALESVRFARIMQEDWEAGQHQICTHCGAALRNYARRADGQVWGLDCLATHLGLRAPRAADLRPLEKVAAAMASYAARADAPGGRDWIAFDAFELARKAGLFGAGDLAGLASADIPAFMAARFGPAAQQGA